MSALVFQVRVKYIRLLNLTWEALQVVIFITDKDITTLKRKELLKERQKRDDFPTFQLFMVGQKPS